MENRWRSIRAGLIVSPLFLVAVGTFAIVGPPLATGRSLSVAQVTGEAFLLSAGGLLAAFVAAGLWLGHRRRFIRLEGTTEGLTFVRRDGVRVRISWTDPTFRIQIWQFPTAGTDAAPRRILVVPGHSIVAGCSLAAAEWLIGEAGERDLGQRESDTKISRDLPPYPSGTDVHLTVLGPADP